VTIAIRQIDPDEWELFREVRLAALRDAPYAFGSTYERERTVDEEHWRERLANRAQFAAVLDGEIVGTAAGIDSDQTTAALISMWVAPPARGKGVGQRLVDAVLDWARQAGYGSVCLWVTDGNLAAERLYLRCGFTRTGAVQQVHPGEARVEYEMSTRL
jgi:RimJ/RimL family protein N-acetyltransferase